MQRRTLQRGTPQPRTLPRSRFAHAILCAAFITGTLGAIGVGTVFAGDDDAPNPVKELKDSVRKLAKHSNKEGYAATVAVRGGTSKSADHELDATSIAQDYSGDIRGAVMHVPDMRVYRVHDKGALFDGERWAMLQTRKEGKELDRLFMFPIRVLTSALSKAENAKWLESTVPPPEPTVEEEQQGRTTVTRKLTQDEIYHRMRLELPNEVAIQVFTEVQNSGCLDGG